MFKKSFFINALLVCAFALQLSACGKDETENTVQTNPGTPPPAVAPINNPYPNGYSGYYYNSYNNLPNYGTQQLPCGSYWYNGYTYSCPFGYIKSGDVCVLNTTQYNSCSNGVWNGWSCVPTTFTCPGGYQYNWWGVCVAIYSTAPNIHQYCQRTAYFNVKGKRKKHCVYTYGM